MAVLRPLKVVIENYPEGPGEEFDAVNHPEIRQRARGKIPFGRELYIEQDDFMESPAKKFFRLSPGNEVRLRYAYFITCREVVKNAARARSSSCAAPTIRRPAAATRRTAARSRRRSIGCRPTVSSRRKSVSTIRCSPSPTRSGGEGFTADLNPKSLEVLSDARSRAGAGGQATRPSPCSSSGRVISSAIRIRRPTARCSIAPSDCAIPSPRRSAEADL